MTPEALAASVAFGLLGGTLAGLFGIGGGAILVPFLYALMDGSWSGITLPAGASSVVAHATSVAVILPASLSALWGYQRTGGVPWPIVLRMGAAAALFAALASRLAPELPEAALRGGFTLFLVAAGLRMLLDRRSAASRAAEGERRGDALLLVGGAAAGALSSLLGVGGGMLAIPFLVYGVRIDVRSLAAASMGVVSAAALAGALGYGLARPSVPLPEGTVGYIFLPATLALAPGAVVGARIGVRLNRRLDADRLRRLFAMLLLLVAARLAWGVIATL